SLFVIALCVQCFFLVAIVDVTYECIHDPDLDCFRKKDDVKLSDTPNDDSPVNCSTISSHDFVTCYRLTAFDPERAFIGAAAGYLLFKMLNFCLLIVAHSLLWAAKKWGSKMVYIKFGLVIAFTMAICVPAILRIYLDEVESAFRKMSYTVLVQIGSLLCLLYYFVALPWDVFVKSEEYYGDASSPDNVDANGNELA
ncbi:Hypothetical predicted protein, partial [Paramuricea clavata]